MDEGTILVYCCPSTIPSLWPPSPSPPLPDVQYIVYRQCVTCGGGGWGVLKCTVDPIQEFYTQFLTRFRTYKTASPPQTKMTSKDNIEGLGSLKFIRPCCAINRLNYDPCQYGSLSLNISQVDLSPSVQKDVSSWTFSGVCLPAGPKPQAGWWRALPEVSAYRAQEQCKAGLLPPFCFCFHEIATFKAVKSVQFLVPVERYHMGNAAILVHHRHEVRGWFSGLNLLQLIRAWICKRWRSPGNRFQGIDSASLCSLAGRFVI